MRNIVLGAVAGMLAAAPAAAFDVAVEAPGGYAVVVVLTAGENEANATMIYKHHEAIVNRFEDRWYVTNITGHQLADIGQICAIVFNSAEESNLIENNVGFACSQWKAPEFLPGYEDVVLLTPAL